MRMKGAVLAILLLYTQTLFAQKVISFPLTAKGDTGLWYKFKMQDADRLGLTDLRTSTERFHIRLWTYGLAVDIWSLDGSHYFGERTKYKYAEKGRYSDTNRFDIEREPLKDEEARALGEHFINRKLSQIPTEDSFANFTPNGIFCGGGYSGCEIEFADQATYSFKTYNNITYKMGDPQSVAIIEFANKVYPFLYFDYSEEYIKGRKQYLKANARTKKRKGKKV